MITSSYLVPLFQPAMTDKIVNALVTMLREKEVEFDTIVFRGMSGSLIAPIIAYLMHKSLLVVRKDSENNHSGYSLEGNHPSRFIIIDDFISSGHTIKTILSDVGDRFPNAICQGIFLWKSSDPDETFGFRGNHIPLHHIFYTEQGTVHTYR